MKINIKEILERESDLVDLKMSEKLLNEPINDVKLSAVKSAINGFESLKNIEDDDIKQELIVGRKNKKLSFKFMFSACFTTLCAIIICFSIILVNRDNNNNSSALTTYIIDVNPSFCITTDHDDRVVSLCSLNKDGDVLLSDENLLNVDGIKLNECMDIVIKCLIDKNYIGLNNSKSSKVVNFNVTNNRERFAMDKADMVKKHFSEKLCEFGFNDYEINSKYLPVPEFKNRMGLNCGKKDLDEMREEIISCERFFKENSSLNFDKI